MMLKGSERSTIGTEVSSLGCNNALLIVQVTTLLTSHTLTANVPPHNLDI